MLNKYPLWKYILILAVLAVGLIYSAPNLYPDDPAIQVSGASTALQVNQADLDRVSTALKESGINVKAARWRNGKGGLSVDQAEVLPAKDVVRRHWVMIRRRAEPGTDHPARLRNLGAHPMSWVWTCRWCALLLEVDMDKALEHA